jgi:hypothetical protein
LRSATGGATPGDWATLRGQLDATALASVAAALGWAAPPDGESLRRDERGVVLMSQLVRFLQCPLQGSARALLPIGDDDSEEIAESAYREHEDFEVERPRATPLLRRAFLDALALDPAGGDGALDAAYARVLDAATLDGTFPSGIFGAATRRTHRALLARWRDGLSLRGLLVAAPAPLYFGHVPEDARGATILPPLALELDLPTRGRAALHGATAPVASVDGVSTTILTSLSRTRGGNYGRDVLGPWIDHLVLSATGRAGADARLLLILRPDPDENEAIPLAPVAPERAASELLLLARQMLSRVHDYFLPCEAVLGWRKKVPPPDLGDYIHVLRLDGWTKFSSEWGPIPNARDYPLAPEGEARRMVDQRFGLLFASCEELNPRPPKAR